MKTKTIVNWRRFGKTACAGAIVAWTVLALTSNSALAANRIFNFYVHNIDSKPVTVTLTTGNCYEGNMPNGEVTKVAPQACHFRWIGTNQKIRNSRSQGFRWVQLGDDNWSHHERRNVEFQHGGNRKSIQTYTGRDGSSRRHCNLALGGGNGYERRYENRHLSR